MQVPTSCYRTGHCHECVVEIRSGIEALSPPTEAESFLRENYRLACQAEIVRGDLDVEFAPLRRTPKILTAGVEKAVPLDPVVTRRGNEVLYDGEPVDTCRGHLYGLADRSRHHHGGDAADRPRDGSDGLGQLLREPAAASAAATSCTAFPTTAGNSGESCSGHWPTPSATRSSSWAGASGSRARRSTRSSSPATRLCATCCSSSTCRASARSRTSR